MDDTSRKKSGPLGPALHALLTAVLNGLTRVQNAAARGLPGERPAWLILELQGAYPARRVRRRRLAPEALLGQDTPESLEEFERKVDALAEAAWLEGVLVRLGALQIGWAEAWAL